MENKHRWSGWPGAFCHYCGISDPMEWAIANDFYDPYTHTWAETPDAIIAKEEYDDAIICKATDEQRAKVDKEMDGK